VIDRDEGIKLGEKLNQCFSIILKILTAFTSDFVAKFFMTPIRCLLFCFCLYSCSPSTSKNPFQTGNPPEVAGKGLDTVKQFSESLLEGNEIILRTDLRDRIFDSINSSNRQTSDYYFRVSMFLLNRGDGLMQKNFSKNIAAFIHKDPMGFLYRIDTLNERLVQNMGLDLGRYYKRTCSNPKRCCQEIKALLEKNSNQKNSASNQNLNWFLMTMVTGTHLSAPYE
jgi:hypothetical protein